MPVARVGEVGEVVDQSRFCGDAPSRGRPARARELGVARAPRSARARPARDVSLVIAGRRRAASSRLLGGDLLQRARARGQAVVAASRSAACRRGAAPRRSSKSAHGTRLGRASRRRGTATSTGAWNRMYASSAEVMVLRFHVHVLVVDVLRDLLVGRARVGRRPCVAGAVATSMQRPARRLARSGHDRSFHTCSVSGASMSRPKRGSPGRSLITKNQPGSSVGISPVAALRLGHGEVEAEEVDVGVDLGLVERRAAPCRRRLQSSSAGVSDTSRRSTVLSIAPDRSHGARLVGGRHRLALPAGAVGVDHRGRVALQQLAADDEHELLLVLARHLAVVVVAELRRRAATVQRRDVVQLLLQASSSKLSALKKLRTSQNWRKSIRAGRSGTRATAARARTRG